MINEFKSLNIDSINAKCLSCLNALKCLEYINGETKFICSEHGIMEDESSYVYELIANNKIETLRRPCFDMNKKLKPVSLCFCVKNNYNCKLKESCIMAHTENEKNVWELLRKHGGVTLDFLIQSILKFNGKIEQYKENLPIYSVGSELRTKIKANDLENLQFLLNRFGIRALLDLDINQESILHLAADKLLISMVSFLLQFSQLSKCLNDPKFDHKTFFNFINHKNKKGETAISALLKKTDDKQKINLIAILFFKCNSYNLNQYVGEDSKKTTILHRLIEQNNLKLIQFICLDIINRVDLKLKDYNDETYRSLAYLNYASTQEKTQKKIIETLNASLITKIISNYINFGITSSHQLMLPSLISDENLNTLEFSFEKISLKFTQ